MIISLARIKREKPINSLFNCSSAIDVKRTRDLSTYKPNLITPAEGYGGFEPREVSNVGILARIPTELAQDLKMCFTIEKWCSMKC